MLVVTGDPDPRPPPSGNPGRAPSPLKRLLPRLGLSLALGLLFAWIVDRNGMPVLPGRAAFSEVVWWTVPAYVGTLAVTHTLRATRWRFLIRPVARIPPGEAILLNWIGFFAIFALPFRLGELARPALTKMRHGVPISAGVGTVAVERVVDGLITAGCLAWAMSVLPRVETADPLARALPALAWTMVLLFGGALAALGLFLWQREVAQALTRRALGVVSRRLGQLLADKVDSVAEGVRSLGDGRLFAAFLLESVGYWGMNALGMWLLAWGTGLPLGPGHAVAVMGVLAMGILLPAGPGLFGNFQLAVSTALRLYVVESMVGREGAAFVFLLYVTQAVLITLAGVIPLYLLRIPFGALLGGTSPPTPAAASARSSSSTL